MNLRGFEIHCPSCLSIFDRFLCRVGHRTRYQNHTETCFKKKNIYIYTVSESTDTVIDIQSKMVLKKKDVTTAENIPKLAKSFRRSIA